MKTLCWALTAMLLAPGTAATAQTQTPPPPGPPPSVSYPTPVERTLANGLRVIAVQRPNVPLVAAQLIVKSGSETDPPARPGIASLAADLLDKGTKTRSALEIAQAIDALGAELEAGAGFDATRVEVSATTPQFGRAFAILSEVVRTPAFAPAEIARAKTQAISNLQLAYSNPSALAQLVAQRLIYGEAPYGQPAEGTPASLGAIARADLERFHRTYFRPDNAVLVLGGDIAPEAAFAEAERVFGNWAKPAAPLPAFPADKRDTASRVVVIDQPEAGRTAVAVGKAVLRRADPAYILGVVTNAVITGYSGRLNAEVRIKRGLSYGAGASLVGRREPGPFVAATLVDHAKAAEATQVVIDTLASLVGQPAGAEELKPRKAVITGGFARSLETIDGLVNQVGTLALYGLPLGQINTFIGEAEAVTPLKVQEFAAGYLQSNQSVVLVGNAKAFLPDLRKRFAERASRIEVIPFQRLDLGRASLVRPTGVAGK
ncbi:M16 family metallopeptidase [Gloeobacter violaceus]|uniref:Glr3687 protein n=1 Tax=Gloeobacter violaceus (strain ATCC 29082 / PCC 7421) TaxID=251221 RepID=Q7NF39_GLOVI|nr:pitrilysin family protein [Gloeobacter violaceus]BAC91628.1 glr3687 [Gloeobacter violaceus PCC 7421]